jgi:hypothetical protein
VTEKNDYLAIVNSDCLSHEVIGIDQDLHNDVASCTETTGVLDGNSNLYRNCINPFNAKLNPICYLLALLGAHPILHISRIRVNSDMNTINSPKKEEENNNNNNNSY